MRWIAVAPPGCPAEVTLFSMGEQWQHYQPAMGKPQAFTLHCDGIDATCRELSERGAQFLGEPQRQAWGSFAILIDSEGSQIVLGQQA